eukprot:3758458-Rhodomonas_salina.1
MAPRSSTWHQDTCQLLQDTHRHPNSSDVFALARRCRCSAHDARSRTSAYTEEKWKWGPGAGPGATLSSERPTSGAVALGRR